MENTDYEFVEDINTTINDRDSNSQLDIENSKPQNTQSSSNSIKFKNIDENGNNGIDVSNENDTNSNSIRNKEIKLL